MKTAEAVIVGIITGADVVIVGIIIGIGTVLICAVAAICILLLVSLVALIGIGAGIMIFGPWNLYDGQYWYLFIVPCWGVVVIIFAGAIKLRNWAESRP